MESLYRTYRPQTFADVVGQQHVTATLERAVLEGRTSHAYLFCGPRGTGKTTMARLLAKALMCEQGVQHLPDGTCEQCQLIASGEHPDVYELDAASRTGVDNVREEIINRVGYAPVRGRYKVYIIDEVHMLTTQAFNALLKTLEEPPAHVVFVLCTTDPQKIPATILSRVQRFDFRPIGNEDILARLVYVCEQEGFTYEDAALELVVRHARGGMRDALSTLEQLSVFGSGVIGLEAAQDLLGAVPGSALGEVVEAIAARDVCALFSQVGALVDAGRDLLQFTRELAAHMRDVYVVVAVGANPALLPAASDVERLSREAQQFGSADRVARILTLLGDVSREMSTAPNQRLVLEIAFTRMARPAEDLTLESLAERVAELERTGVVAAVPQDAAATPVSASESAPAAQAPAPIAETALVAQAPAPTPQPVPVAQQAPEPKPQPNPEPQVVPASQSVSNARPAPEPQPQPQAKPAPQQSKPSTARDKGALQRQWRTVVSNLVARIPARGSLLSSAMATDDDGSVLVVSLPKGSSFALKMLERPDIRADVEAAVGEVFGSRALRFTEGIGSGSSAPLRQRQAAPAERPAYAQQPTPTMQQPTPRPQPQVAPAQAPSAAPQTQPQPSAQPAPYPMPWDEPASQVPSAGPAYDEVPYEPVPYEEMGMGGYGVAYDEASVVPAAQSQPAPEPAPEPQPAPAPELAPELIPAPTPATVQVPEPAPVPDPEPQPASQDRPFSTPDDLPDDLVAVLENAFEVFGSDVRIH
ncbi:MAG: DNA polymerase III subunit gamma/tau [Coriobacteriales bacterium]|nr:DNA polymerase III subunit gamma/tau [Coriobacteriales bacterium]